jgi:hypothetical protein
LKKTKKTGNTFFGGVGGHCQCLIP